MSDLIVYASALSPFGARVRLAVAAKAVPIMFMPPPSAGISEITPLGKFPVLVDGDKRVVESIAIIEYLEDRFPAALHLLPVDHHERAVCRSIVSAFDATVIPAMNPIWEQLRKPNPDAAVVHGALQNAVSIWARVAGLFCGQGLALGKSLTIADCAMVPFSTLLAILTERFDTQIDGGARLAEWSVATAELDICRETDALIRAAFAQVFSAAA
jgi:glutathione S-transferase